MSQDSERRSSGPAGEDVVTDQGFGVAGGSAAAGGGVTAVPPTASGGSADPGAAVASGSPNAGAESGAGGLGALLSGVVGDLQGLLRGELQLAKTELKEEATAAAGGAAAAAAGGITGLVGIVFVMHGVAELLSKVMPRWMANTLVGLGLLAGAGSLGMSGKEKLSAAKLAPQQTLQTLRENASWAKDRLSSVTGGQPTPGQ